MASHHSKGPATDPRPQPFSRQFDPDRLHRIFGDTDFSAELRDEKPDLPASLRASWDEQEGVAELVEEWRLSGQRIVRAFCLAIALFCIVYFGGSLLWSVL